MPYQTVGSFKAFYLNYFPFFQESSPFLTPLLQQFKEFLTVFFELMLIIAKKVRTKYFSD